MSRQGHAQCDRMGSSRLTNLYCCAPPDTNALPCTAPQLPVALPLTTPRLPSGLGRGSSKEKAPSRSSCIATGSRRRSGPS
jgi:hypothetical protein